MKPQVVYDAMIFVQAAQPNRVDRTLRLVREGKVTLCTSPDLLAEVLDVLSRPSTTVKLPSLTPAIVDAFMSEINRTAVRYDSVPPAFTWPRHPDDDHLFDLAIAADADYLVTWESRILALATEESPDADRLRALAPRLSILSPPDFAAALRDA